MAERSPGRSERLDRVTRPDAGRTRDRDEQGKEALYSTSPKAAPSEPVLVVCERCDIERGIGFGEALRLLKPPFFYNPASRRLWARCPTCERRSWLHVRSGQALRAFLDRPGR